MARTAAQKEAAMKGRGPRKKGSRSDARKDAQMRRVAVMTGVTGNQAPVQAAPQEESAGESLLNLGKDAIKSLSVPQAALYTTVAKGAGKNVSWKNAIGDFYTADNGERGSSNVLGSLGIDNKWAKLATEIVVDPLWLVGGGLVKTAAKSGKIAETIKGVDAVTDLEKSVKESNAIISRLARNARRAKTSKTRDKHLKAIDKERKKLNKLKADADKLKADAKRKKKVEDSDFVDLIKTDEAGNVENLDQILEKLRKFTEKDASREGMNYSLNLGAGKFKKQIDLGINAEKGLLGRRGAKAFKAGMMGMKPIEKVAHALRRSGSEMSEGVSPQILELASKHGMTVKSGTKEVINEGDAVRLGVYRQLRSLNHDAGEALRQDFMRRGLWTKEHDDLVKLMDSRNEYLKGADAIGGGERPFNQELTDLEKQLKDIAKSREKLLKQGEKGGKVGPTLTKLAEQEKAVQADIKRVMDRGPYTKVGKREEDIAADTQLAREQVRRGTRSQGFEYRRIKDPKKKNKERERFDNSFKTVSEDEFVDDLVAAGMDERTAQELQQLIASELNLKGLDGFRAADEAFKHGRPEWNAFTLAGRRENDHIWRQVDNQIEQLVKEAGLDKDSELGKILVYGINREQPGTLTGSAFGRHALTAMANFKGFLTFVNPSHYIRNATGDFWNSLVNGNMRHLGPQAAVPKTEKFRLANSQQYIGQGKVDKEILNKKFKVGKREFTGQELLTMSRMVGLGRGYVGTDVAIMVDAFAKANHSPKEFYRFMQRMNIKRENSQRMHTWIRHMQAGDDPMVAGVKTLRVHFDYTQLTEFEKLMLRNVLLFYTWMKRNLLLQSSGMLTRPGLYSAAGDIENARPKIANEPGYYSTQAALPIPGLGAVNVGNPVGDLFKFELTWDGFRRDVLGAVTPPIRVPTELATNQKFFTGERIQDYEGQKSPALAASILSAIGVPLTQTTKKSGGEQAPGISPRIAHALSQISGPQGATIAATIQPDAEGNLLEQGIGRFLGTTPQADRKEAFARSVKYLKAKKKADATRARNAQR